MSRPLFPPRDEQGVSKRAGLHCLSSAILETSWKEWYHPHPLPKEEHGRGASFLKL